MRLEKLQEICNERGIDIEDVIYNCGYDIADLRLFRGEIFRPKYFIGNKPKYEYIAKYEVILEDCVSLYKEV